MITTGPTATIKFQTTFLTCVSPAFFSFQNRLLSHQVRMLITQSHPSYHKRQHMTLQGHSPFGRVDQNSRISLRMHCWRPSLPPLVKSCLKIQSTQDKTDLRERKFCRCSLNLHMQQCLILLDFTQAKITPSAIQRKHLFSVTVQQQMGEAGQRKHQSYLITSVKTNNLTQSLLKGLK